MTRAAPDAGSHRILLPKGWPRPRGYANGLVAEGRTVYVGGQIGWDTEGRLSCGFLAQLRKTLENILAVLAEAGAGPQDLVRLTWFVVDIDPFFSDPKGLGRVYREVVGPYYPAMSVVQVVRLVEREALVEIEATAVVPTDTAPGGGGMTAQTGDTGMDYGDYLQLDTLLSAQTTRTEEHDEVLFVIIHQATELWLKLSIHEIRAARAHIMVDALRSAFKTLSRVARIQAHMIQAWEILATMTPFDYANFRAALGSSSGFQSFQYRELEFLLGAKDRRMLDGHRRAARRFAGLATALQTSSLYDEALRLLWRRGFDIPATLLERDWSRPYVANAAVEAAWLTVYRETDTYWDLYELGEKLVDLEYRLQQWRFSHMKTVERIIGFKRGTGGSEGVSYLVKALDRRLFPELLTLRTTM